MDVSRGFERAETACKSFGLEKGYETGKNHWGLGPLGFPLRSWDIILVNIRTSKGDFRQELCSPCPRNCGVDALSQELRVTS